MTDDDDEFNRVGLDPLERLLVVATRHPLSAKNATLQQRAYYAELIVSDSSARYTHQPKDSFMGSQNVVFLSDFQAKRTALLLGAGYGWMPTPLIEAQLLEGTLQVLQGEPSRWTFAPQVVTRKSRPLGRAGQLFVDTLLLGSPALNNIQE